MGLLRTITLLENDAICHLGETGTPRLILCGSQRPLRLCVNNDDVFDTISGVERFGCGLRLRQVLRASALNFRSLQN